MFIVWLAMQGRLLLKERLIKLHVRVTDANWCLCDDNTKESHQHLFVDCNWAKTIRDSLFQWTGVHISLGNYQHVLANIKRKHGKQGKKGSDSYTVGRNYIPHIWRARNWRIFRGHTVQKELAIAQIKTERIEKFNKSRKMNSSRRFVQRLLCN